MTLTNEERNNINKYLIKDNLFKKLIIPLVTTEIGKISLGKYTFLIIPAFAKIQDVPWLIAVINHVHGSIPIIKKTT